MSLFETPALRRASTTLATACELAASAADAVFAWLAAPNEKVARPGVTAVEPVPTTVPPPEIASVEVWPRAPDGARMPANAATARPAAAIAATRMGFMERSFRLLAT